MAGGPVVRSVQFGHCRASVQRRTVGAGAIHSSHRGAARRKRSHCERRLASAITENRSRKAEKTRRPRARAPSRSSGRLGRGACCPNEAPARATRGAAPAFDAPARARAARVAEGVRVEVEKVKSVKAMNQALRRARLRVKDRGAAPLVKESQLKTEAARGRRLRPRILSRGRRRLYVLTDRRAPPRAPRCTRRAQEWLAARSDGLVAGAPQSRCAPPSPPATVVQDRARRSSADRRLRGAPQHLLLPPPGRDPRRRVRRPRRRSLSANLTSPSGVSPAATTSRRGSRLSRSAALKRGEYVRDVAAPSAPSSADRAQARRPLGEGAGEQLGSLCDRSSW